MMTTSIRSGKASNSNHLICLFNDLYRIHKTAIYGYICYLTQNKAEAEDLYQDTWLRVVKNLHQVNDIERTRPWLYTIATNLYKDYLRKKKNKQKYWEKNVIQQSSENPKNLHKNSIQAEEAELKAVGKIIVHAVNDLPEKLRQVFILRQMEEFSYAEISDILNLPEGSAKSRMHRAVQILRRELAGLRPAHIPTR